MTAPPSKQAGPPANGSQKNRIVEPEFEVRRRNVRALVFRQTTEFSGTLAVAFLRHDTPYQLFPCELSDHAFTLAELNDLSQVLEVAKTCLEAQASKLQHRIT
jgi:hypothetical protein